MSAARRKVSARDVAEETWSSPRGTCGGGSRELSVALGRKPQSTDLRQRHPFGGALPDPHSHRAQWEFYHVVGGRGAVRHEGGTTAIEPGDAFLFEPGQPHQLLNDGAEDLVLYIVADNPIGETCHYPDSGKWLVRSPEPRLVRSEPIDDYDGGGADR